MLVAVDLDGTADTYPRELQAIMTALRAAGNTVIVLTGTHTDAILPDEIEVKKLQLESLGLDGCYDDLVVVRGPESDVADRKVAYLKSANAAVLIDNRKKNCKAATNAGILALCPWGSKE